MPRRAAGSPALTSRRRRSTPRPAPSTATPGTASATVGPRSRRSPGRPPAAAAAAPSSSRGSTPRDSWPRPGAEGSGSWGIRCLRTSSSRCSARSGWPTAARASESGGDPPGAPTGPNIRISVVPDVERKTRRAYKTTRRDLANRVYATDEERNYAIAKAEELEDELGSNHPSFVKPMTQSHVTGGFWLVK